jgi:predicted kinase
MNINEAFTQQVLEEGVHDKGIFKAVFLAGGSGSGKDFVMDKTLGTDQNTLGFVEINSDRAFEYLMKRENLDMKMPDSEEEIRNQWRKKAKSITELKERLALTGRNGIVINGTGDDFEKIAKMKAKLEEMGYDTQMLMVNTSDEVSKQRNLKRDRTVPENVRKQKWDNAQSLRPKYAKLFGDSYKEYDNSEDYRTVSPERREKIDKDFLTLYKGYDKFVKTPPKSEAARKWIANEMQKKDTMPIPKDGPEKQPHPGSNAADEARQLGLSYFGFGRYGKNGHVTHRSVHDKLVAVEKKPTVMRKTPAGPKPMMKENVDSQFASMLNETVSLTITGDTAEEVTDLMARIRTKLGINTQYGLSDKSDVVSLGARYNPVGPKSEEMTISNEDVENIKLNEENYNVSVVEKSIQEERSGQSGTKTYSSAGRGNTKGTTYIAEGCGCTEDSGVKQNTAEEASKEKKTKLQLSQFKTKVRESIDKGIEPGMSMAAGGESGGRDMGEKNDKKGKASPVAESGGETMATSMGDQKEGELRNQGIKLSTFRAKNPV